MLPLEANKAQFSKFSSATGTFWLKSFCIAIADNDEMNVENGSKDLKKYPQISRKIRDTLARLIRLIKNRTCATNAGRAAHRHDAPPAPPADRST